MGNICEFCLFEEKTSLRCSFFVRVRVRVCVRACVCVNKFVHAVLNNTVRTSL